MFGYIKPAHNELLVKEYETYKAIYCGLCRQLGKEYGFFFRLTLSYDFTFLALVALAVQEVIPEYHKFTCPAHPFAQCHAVNNPTALAYTADCAVLMLYYKLLDNVDDHNLRDKVTALTTKPFVHAAYKKARERVPEVAAALAAMYTAQHTLEAAATPSIDEACDPTATALAAIMAPLGTTEAQKRVLARMGYLLGRYIYLCDALDDLPDDEKRGNYNPILALCNHSGRPVKEALQSMKCTINHTIAEAAGAATLLQTNMFGNIIENIITGGLVQSAEEIYKRRGVQRD